MSHQKPNYSAFIDIGPVTVKVLPGDVTRERAEQQVSEFLRQLQPLPGGTQLCRGYIEPTS